MRSIYGIFTYIYHEFKLGGGFVHIFYVHPGSLGFHDPIWLLHIFQKKRWFNHHSVSHEQRPIGLTGVIWNHDSRQAKRVLEIGSFCGVGG